MFPEGLCAGLPFLSLVGETNRKRKRFFVKRLKKILFTKYVHVYILGFVYKGKSVPQPYGSFYTNLGGRNGVHCVEHTQGSCRIFLKHSASSSSSPFSSSVLVSGCPYLLS